MDKPGGKTPLSCEVTAVSQPHIFLEVNEKLTWRCCVALPY